MMRRAMAMVATTILILGGGCGSKSYEARLENTLERKKYEKRLNDNLTPAPTKGDAPFQDLSIYIRPPKNLAQTKEFQLAALPEGQFDLQSSFLEPKKQSLHVLARVKQPKNAPGKKAAAPTPAETAERGEFNRDVVGIVGNVYGVGEEFGLEKFKEVTKKSPISQTGNTFKQHSFKAEDKEVQVYLYKSDPYEVALIFEFPSAEAAGLASKINLCLESFAVGNRARNKFAGALGDEIPGDGGAGGGAPGQPF